MISEYSSITNELVFKQSVNKDKTRQNQFCLPRRGFVRFCLRRWEPMSPTREQDLNLNKFNSTFTGEADTPHGDTGTPP